VYLGSDQDGGRFRADRFRLSEGEYVPPDAPQAAERPNLLENPGFESGPKPWYFQFQEQQNLRRTYRRTSFLLNRLLANMGVRGATPLLPRFARPPAGRRAPSPSAVRNGDFRQVTGPGPMPEHWEFSSELRSTTCTREPSGADGKPALRLELKGKSSQERATIMLAQHGIAVKAGQWYRISLRSRAEGLAGKSVNLTIQDTQKWTSFIEYLDFTPGKEWRTFSFLVQSNGTADRNTKFQIWHGNPGTLWLADIVMMPVASPSAEGRWSRGLYVDQPEDWDDPYRFFRW
jgi:hypothetical protein